MSGYIVVAGGCNIDIQGRGNTELRVGESTPGRVSISYGGVGRNIAENLARLGTRVKLITVLGGDSWSREMERSTAESGVDMDLAIRLPEQGPSIYVAHVDPGGEMQSAVSDMTAFDSMDPRIWRDRAEVIRDAAMVIADTNLPESSLVALREITGNVPLWLDPVSWMKARRAVSILPGLHTVKPNTAEALVWAGEVDEDDEKTTCQHLADDLRRLGIQRVALSAGATGFFINGDGITGWVDPVAPPGPVRSVTGAGDAATAALAWATLAGHPFDEAARLALAASALTITVREAVHPSISPDKLANLIGKGESGENSTR